MLFRSWLVDISPPQPVQRQGFLGIRFAFHPGTTTAPAIPVFSVIVDELSVDLARDPQQVSVDLERKEWQMVDIPFTAYDLPNDYGDGLRDQVDIVDSIRLEGNMTGVFYLDNIRIAASFADLPLNTAVVEEQDNGGPQGFRLEQNYPNPFNSETVIRYGLPADGPVELAVFNTDGQHVATLVKGLRRAGNYALRWDGRDNRARTVASGIYIYRLRAGELMQTQKLTLLR